MHPFELLGEPIRRRIVEILASGEQFSGEIEAVIVHEFGVGRSAVQHHLAVLRRHGWAVVREEENQRGYRLDDSVVPRIAAEVRHLKRRWKHRIGFAYGLTMKQRQAEGVYPPSRRGLRGHGRDPDDPWLVNGS